MVLIHYFPLDISEGPKCNVTSFHTNLHLSYIHDMVTLQKDSDEKSKSLQHIYYKIKYLGIPYGKALYSTTSPQLHITEIRMKNPIYYMINSNY